MGNNFEIEMGNGIIVGTLFKAETSNTTKVLIFMEGSGGTRERFNDYGEYFTQDGYSLVCFDYRGRGDSHIENFATIGTQIEDIRAIVGYVESQFPSKSVDITIIATSMGAHVAAATCNFSPNIKHLVLVAPAVYPTNFESMDYTTISKKHFEDLGEEGLKSNLLSARSIQEIRKFTGEVSVVFLGEDATIPPWMVQLYIDNCVSASQVRELTLEDAPHAVFRDEGWRDKARELLSKII